MSRFKSWYEEKGVSTETFLSVEARANACPLDFDLRIHAIQEFQTMPEAAALAQANKRVANILTKNKQEQKEQSQIDPSLLQEQAETILVTTIQEKVTSVIPLITQQAYTEALQSLAELHQPIDNFFEQVMVDVKDEALKQNRLEILLSLQKLFLHIADISLLVPPK
jgi:glycyl-tRNA synthetase beta chain